MAALVFGAAAHAATILALIALSLGRPHAAFAAGVVGTGTPESCTEAALDAALAGGGTVTFNCGASPATITVTGTKTISADTTIDGGGLITISGGNSVGVFFVKESVKFTVQNLTIANGNSADGGGGIFNVGTLTVTNSTFSGNSAPNEAGGGIDNLGGTVAITNSTFSGNSVTGDFGLGGGGIANDNSGTLTVANSTFSGNSANRGSGIFLSASIFAGSGLLTVTNSTLSGNFSNGSGGTIYVTVPCDSGNALCPAITNTIVANNTGGNCAGTITDGGHNLDDGTSCGFGMANGSLSNTDPKLDAAGLANNGGPTQTIAVQADSPAINAGDADVCAAAPVNNRDQRGFVRPGTSATRCSIGAFEFNSPGPPSCEVGDCNDDGEVAIDELITLVNITLGDAQPSTCPYGMPSGADVNVALIIQAVNNALHGCSASKVCGGIAALPCGTGEVCDLRDATCAVADLAGRCVPGPSPCAFNIDPVCGCDGVTYPNDCARLNAGATLAHTGACLGGQ